MKRFLYLLAALAMLLLSGCVAVPYDSYYAYPAQPVYEAPYPYYYSYPSTSIYFGYSSGWGGRGHWRH
ncbi:hypothetical protein [Herbaspirillum sp.]|uniref:hypothetical protein n=1 Tax=Herbaspirillum sp. TaxID=1890675 RepID=UPI001B1006E8|nr:hypothetical protein [Herbaspirillum sp.]MBO9535871.1 hypothetical protein [Herbaspirillum sp.]